MSGQVERVARAIAASDEANPPIACACSGKESPEDFDCSCRMFDARRRARAAINASNLTLYETALRTIQEALPKYAREDATMTAEEFARVVLGAVDNPRVFRALNGTSEPSNAIVDEGMEEGK